MIIHLECKAVMEILGNSIAVGWPEGEPTRVDWIITQNEVTRLLGYEIVSWGAFVNPKTNVFWTEIGDARICKNAEPLLINLLK